MFPQNAIKFHQILIILQAFARQKNSVDQGKAHWQLCQVMFQ